MRYTAAIAAFLIGAALLPSSAFADAKSAATAIKEEPKVKDLLYDPQAPVKWHVGVLDNGTPRWGYAMYLCEVLREHGVVTKSTEPWEQVVRVVDIVKVTRGTNFRNASLGSVDCATYKKQQP